MPKKRDRSGSQKSWRQRVDKALRTLGPGEHTRAEVVAAVGRQKFRKSATWKQTVSRVLQEIRNSGEISFDKPGRYHSFDLRATPPETIADRIQRVLSESFDVTGRKLEVTTPNKFETTHWHHYTFSVAAEEGASEGYAETIAQAALAAAKWYSGPTLIGIEVMTIDSDSGEEQGFRWLTLAWALTPRTAAGHIEFAMGEIGKEGKYQLTDQIATIGLKFKESVK